MDEKRESINYNLEQLYIAKLMHKYKSKGYEVYVDEKVEITRKSIMVLDLYCLDPKTGEEIIFEVKSKKKLNRIDIQNFVAQRNRIKEFYPKAKIELVVAEDFEKEEPKKSDLNDHLFEYIQEKFSTVFKEKVQGFIDFYDVDYVKQSEVDFNDFHRIRVKGLGNIRFLMLTEKRIDEKVVSNESLSEGFPFDFEINLKFNGNEASNNKLYEVDADSDVRFQLKDLNE